MIYWIHKKAVGYEEWQVKNAIEEGRIRENEYTLVDDEVWKRIMLEAEQQNKQIVNSPATNYPSLADYPEPTEKEKAISEIATLKNYLDSTDYCVIKCMEEGLQLSVVYPAEHSNRAEARKRINFLEENIGVKHKNTK